MVSSLVYVARVLHMSHVLVQRKYFNLCRPLLRTLDFACQPYPQFFSLSHDIVVLSCTLALLSSLVGNRTQHSKFHHWSLTGWFPLCSMTRHLFTHWDSCSVLDAIILIGGFLAFVNNFSSLAAIQRVLFVYYFHLAHTKDT